MASWKQTGQLVQGRRSLDVSEASVRNSLNLLYFVLLTALRLDATTGTVQQASALMQKERNTVSFYCSLMLTVSRKFEQKNKSEVKAPLKAVFVSLANDPAAL